MWDTNEFFIDFGTSSSKQTYTLNKLWIGKSTKILILQRYIDGKWIILKQEPYIKFIKAAYIFKTIEQRYWIYFIDGWSQYSAILELIKMFWNGYTDHFLLKVISKH